MNGADGEEASSAEFALSPRAERWTLSPSATAFVRERAQRLNTDPATILEDLVLVERRRVEGAL
jgi:hypothetical protein